MSAGFQIFEGELADVCVLADDVPGIGGIVGLGEADDIADILRRSHVVLRPFPLDGNGGFGDVLDDQLFVGGDGRLPIPEMGGGGHAAVVERILAEVTGFIIGHHVEGIG